MPGIGCIKLGLFAMFLVGSISRICVYAHLFRGPNCHVSPVTPGGLLSLTSIASVFTDKKIETNTTKSNRKH